MLDISMYMYYNIIKLRDNILKEYKNMKAMRNIVDTWNMIEKYNIKGYEVTDSCTILVPTNEYERLMNSVRNKQYIKNISK